MQNFPCLAVLFQCFFPVLWSATFFFIYFFSLFPLPSGRHASGNQESWQFLSLKSVPRQFPLVLTQPSPPSPTFLNERKCHSENWSSSRQRISEHCWVCDLISHIGHAREKPSPLLKISWKPGTCKPRWDFVELWLVILADTIWSQSLSSFFMVTDACVF